jgi:hypothetical protein
LTVERFTEAMNEAAEASEGIRIPTEEDIDAAQRFAGANPTNPTP